MNRVHPPQAEIVVDLDSIRYNIHKLRLHLDSTSGAALMVVVKADGYGHGMVQVARAAQAAGADWLGVATVEEALALRRAGVEGPLLCWLLPLGADLTPVVRHGIDIGVTSEAHLQSAVAAAILAKQPAQIHLMIDTGMSRDGVAPNGLPGLLATTRRAVEDGYVEVAGMFSHLACADEPDHPANAAQEKAFKAAVALAAEYDLHPRWRHLANSAATLLRPSAHFDLVRVGIAAYGLSPAPQLHRASHWGLVPAMTVKSRLAAIRYLESGDGVSYGHTFVATEPLRVGLVPMGYGDGVPRHASNTAFVTINGEKRPILGRVCMDQFVVAAPEGEVGDEVVLFSNGSRRTPTAQDWADACDTISYEIVTRMGGRPQRTWVGA